MDPISSSPEFEFQFNHPFPSPTSLHSADQLFFRGILLPLHLLPPSSDPTLPSPPPPSDPSPSPSILSAAVATSSKRWTHIFKKPDKKPQEDQEDGTTPTPKKKEKDKKRDRKGAAAAFGSSSAELNINLWPFSRSRSAGSNSTTGSRAKSAIAARKVSSAPCSRSNSAGESKSRRSLPLTSPGRVSGGVHLGRASPVWQLPRTLSGRAAPDAGRRSKAGKGTAAAASAVPTTTTVRSGGKGRVLALNVPMCIGYRHHLSCRSGEASEVGDGGGGGSKIVGNSGGNLFNLRNLFTKKVY